MHIIQVHPVEGLAESIHAATHLCKRLLSINDISLEEGGGVSRKVIFTYTTQKGTNVPS